MRKLGAVHLLSHSGKLILRCKVAPRIGEGVFDSHLNRVGVVYDVFGPVAYPFVSVLPTEDDPAKLVGNPLYLREPERRSSWKVDGWKRRNS